MSNSLLIENANAMTSKSPMTQIDSAVVCTKDKVFLFPKKSTGNFIILNTVKTHSFFEGKSIEEGLKDVISNSSNEIELQETLSNLLENNAQYIHDLNSATKKSIKGFLGRKTMHVRHGKSWISFTPRGKEATKALVGFYHF